MAQQQLAMPKFDWINPGQSLGAVQEAVNDWARRQHPGVEVALATFTGGFQGACLGGLMGWVSNLDPQANQQAAANGKMAITQGGPLVQARNFAVMTGVNSGLSLAVKKARKGKEDVQTAMLAALGSGAAFSLVSGINPPGSNPVIAALATGMSFAVLQGAFYKIGEMFGGGKKSQEVDVRYLRARSLLAGLGLQQYEKNLRKGQLTDDTIVLWNDAALQEVKVPAGPRLLILDHIDQYRHLLKPAVPPPKGK